jgi:hypothetical protein
MKLIMLITLFFLHIKAQDCSEVATTNNDTIADNILNVLSLGTWNAARSNPNQSEDMQKALKVCQWQSMSTAQCEECASDEVPHWDDEYEVGYARTGLVRGFRTGGAALGTFGDVLLGHTRSQIDNMLEELPNQINRLENSLNEFPKCAQILEHISKNCSKGKFDLSKRGWKQSMGCMGREYPDLATCIQLKCPTPIDIDENLQQQCSPILPFKDRVSDDVIKMNSLLTGLYIIKNEGNETALVGETESQRITRRTINLVMDYLGASDIPGQVDNVIQAFQRGSTNCYGFSLAIKSALSYTAEGKGVNVDIIKISTPAHAWNRIHLSDPEISFDIDGVSYDQGPPVYGYAKHEFFPLPIRSMRERPHCPRVLASGCLDQTPGDFSRTGIEEKSTPSTGNTSPSNNPNESHKN